MTESEAEKVMKFWLKKSGFKKWELFKEYILFRMRGCPPVYLMTWDNSRFYSADAIRFKKKHVTCREVVQKCLDKCMKGLEIYVTDTAQREVIVLMKPFQSLEELLIEVDLFYDAGDALDDIR